MKRKVYVYVIVLLVLAISIINVRLNNSKYRTLFEMSKSESLTQETTNENTNNDICCSNVQQSHLQYGCNTKVRSRCYTETTNITTVYLCCETGNKSSCKYGGPIWYNGDSSSTNWDGGTQGSTYTPYTCK
ncbi:MAG: hypothetical protein LBG80_03910 [Bacteroidales bacterium]|jgi:hypothetical protein|nr:hypothetical protein [Bacteroidales bacterium]